MNIHPSPKSSIIALAASLCLVSVAEAGPPFLTDDPEPTAYKHWEIYGPLLEAEGRGREFDGTLAVEINYGLTPKVQLTLGLPVDFFHDATGTHSGAGDLEASLKYRFLDDKKTGWQAAVFPGISLPTAGKGFGAERVTGLIPVWLQKEQGDWTLFGGGGIAINPGPGNRNYWTGGLAASRQLTRDLRLGAEINRHGPDSAVAHGVTSLGIAAIYQVKAPVRILVSAGPSIEDGRSGAGFHAFMALGLDY